MRCPKRPFPLAIVLAFMLCHSCLFAQTQTAQPFEVQPKEWGFMQNRGQLADEHQKPLPDIKFYGHDGGVYLYCRQGMISFVFSKITEIEAASGKHIGQHPIKKDSPKSHDSTHKTLITASRADLVLLNANPNAQITLSGQLPYYENFYSAHTPASGITDVHSYKTVTYQNIYPYVDLVLECRTHGLKYTFVVRPGGNTNDIQLQWNGLQTIDLLENGGLSYSLVPLTQATDSIPHLQENKPYTTQGGGEISSMFVKDDNIISFKTNEYNKNEILVIDPGLIWGTYYGSSPNVEESAGVAIDSLSNPTMVGVTEGSAGLATTGAYQTSYWGGSDNVFVAGFTSLGKRIWSTYYGGEKGAVATGIATDKAGNVFISGITSSDSGIASSGAFRTKKYGPSTGYGQEDAFIAKFSPAGKLSWGTYCGGDGEDEALAIATDPNGNVYITGWTTSDSGIATSGTYQTKITYATYLYDAFIEKFSNSGSRIWGTYFGGGGTDGRDEAHAIATDKAGNVYITGWTQSSTGIASAGAYQTALGGKGYEDAFIAKFSTNGSGIWSTYYGSGSYPDYAEGITVDNSGNIYITGYTNSDSGISTTATYQPIYGSARGGYANDGFVVKMSSSGSRVWGTYFGGDNEDQGKAITHDKAGNIYVTGFTEGYSGLATANAYQSTFLGNQNSMILKFYPSGGMDQATYFGGNNKDYAAGIVVDSFNNVFLTGSTSSSTHMSTSGAFQTKGGGLISGVGYNFDAFLARFKFENFNTDAGIVKTNTQKGSFCPSKKPINILLKNFGTNILDSVKIQYSINRKTKGTYTWKGKLLYDSTAAVTIDTVNFTTGFDTIKAWTTQPNGALDSFPQNDSSAAIIDTVFALPAAFVGLNDSICSGDPENLGASSVTGNSYSWTSRPSGFTSSLSKVTVNPIVNTTYYLLETSIHGCTKTDSATIRVFPLPVESLYASSALECQLNNGFVFIDSTTIGAGKLYARSWDFGDGNNDSAKRAVHSYDAPGTYTVVLTDESAKGCSSSKSKTIKVLPSPKAAFSTNDSIECLGGNSFSFKDKSSATIKFAWNWTFGDSIGSALQNPSHTFSLPGTYQTKLLVTGTNGCKDSTSKTLVVHAQPKAIFVVNDSVECLRGNSFTFTDKSISSDSFSRSWNFGDGTNATPANTLHSYPKPGNYTISLTIGTQYGCSANLSKNLAVFDQPKAMFSLNNATQCFTGNNFVFTDQSTLSLGSISSWDWSFGDSSVSSKESPNYTYANPGKYDIKLVITSDKGCPDSMIEVVNVNKVNILTINGNYSVCPGTSVPYSVKPDSGGKYLWNITGGALLSRKDSNGVNVHWTTPGSGAIRLAFTNALGCLGTTTNSVEVNKTDKPIISGSSSICSPALVAYSTPDISGNTYLWQLTGGQMLSGALNANILVQFDTIGSATIKAYETNSFGCMDSDTFHINVLQRPTAKFGFKNGCEMTDIHFADSSKNANSYSWDFGDSATSSDQDPLHAYHNPGNMLVKEIVTSNNGCTDSVNKTITIYPISKIHWSIVTDTGRTVHFTAHDTDIQSYHWGFGDGGQSDSNQAKHHYAKNGTYDISLRVLSVEGCAAQADTTLNIDFSCETDNITIAPDPFEDQLTIKYMLCENSKVSIAMYDMLGRVVNTYTALNQAPGDYQYLYDHGIAPASGTYVLVIQINGKVTIKKVLKIR